MITRRPFAVEKQLHLFFEQEETERTELQKYKVALLPLFPPVKNICGSINGIAISKNLGHAPIM
jgi:hypothetical protein